jgi:hypothetical protein
MEKKTRHRLKSLVTKENIKHEAQRAKFALGKSVRNKLFNEIASYNARLKELLDTSDEIEGIRRSRRDLQGPNSIKGLSKLWKHASNVFRLLQKAWGCECSSIHHVNIMLQHRTILDVNFTLNFLFSRRLAPLHCPSWYSFRSRIDLADNEKSDSTIQVQRAFSELTIGTPKRSNMRSSLRSSLMKDILPSNSMIMYVFFQSHQIPRSLWYRVCRLLCHIHFNNEGDRFLPNLEMSFQGLYPRLS